MKKIITLLCIIPIVAFAQNEQMEINAIKNNPNILYATGVSKVNLDDASNNAKDLLALEIEQWLKENNSENISGYVAKSREKLSQITTRRGNLYRVFAYVRKIDILPYYKEEDVMVVDYVKQDNLKSNTLKVANNDLAKPDNIPTNKVRSQIDSVQIVSNNNKSNTVESLPHANRYKPNLQENEMISIKSFAELNEYINNGRKQELISDVGKYSNLPETGTCYVFIHNKEGKIPACLKLIDGKAINMQSGENDIVSNYKGCGAIWIILKKD